MSKVEKFFNLVGLRNYVYAVKSYHNISHIRSGATMLGLGFGLASYIYYRLIREYNLKASQYMTTLSSTDVANLNKYFKLTNAGVQVSFLKLQQYDYDKHFKMQPTQVTGYFDHAKEVHVKVPNSNLYRVFTPFYYLDYNEAYIKNEMTVGKDQLSKYAITKGAIVVERGL